MSGLRDDYLRELIARGITTLEHAYQLVTDLDESRISYFHRTDFRDNSKAANTTKPSFSWSFPAPSKPASNTSSVKPTGSSSEPTKVNPRTQWYRCQGYGHLTSQCLSQTKTLLMEVAIEDITEEGDVPKWLCTNKMMTQMPLLKNINSMAVLELWERRT